jgi:hypothetical protein
MRKVLANQKMNVKNHLIQYRYYVLTHYSICIVVWVILTMDKRFCRASMLLIVRKDNLVVLGGR